MSMHRFVTAGLLAVLVLGAAACGGDDDTVSTGDGADSGAEPDATTDTGGTGDDAAPFGEHQWRLASGSIDGNAIAPPADRAITIERRGDEVGGTAACNSYFASFSEGDRLFASVGSTEMACLEPGVMEAESAYLEALGRVQGAERDGEALVLRGTDVELRFEIVPPVPDTALTGTSWQLDTIDDGTAAWNGVGFEDVVLTFDAGGTYGGFDGCTPMGGTYMADGTELVLSNQVGADAQCPSDDVARTANIVISVLSARPVAEISGDRLTLSNADYSLTFRAQ